MRALTLWQPYAALIFAGVKIHETRSWAAPTAMIGQRFVVHSAKAIIEPSAELDMLCDEVLGPGWRERMFYGAGLGTVKLAGCAPMTLTRPANDADRIAGDWSDGRFAWLLTDPQPFAEPIPRRGGQRIWNWGEAA